VSDTVKKVAYVRFNAQRRFRALLWTESHCFFSTEAVHGNMAPSEKPMLVQASDVLCYVTRRGKVVQHLGKSDAEECRRKWTLECRRKGFGEEVVLF
jgi:hypothetical protein